MKQIRITLWLAVFPAIATLALVASTAAQTVVVGTGNPDIDVPAVQAAVDEGGQVILKGHFSFNRPPTIVPALPGSPLATVLVSKAVAISGVQDANGDMTSIEVGTVPFYVEAPGAPVTIQGLRFVRPKVHAILVYAVSGLVIASCKIEGVEPLPNFGAGAINIKTSGNIPTPDQPGHPENISGTLLIVNNDIDVVGGTAQDLTLGLILWSVGVPGAEVEAYVSGNTIRNFTERAMNIRRVVGRAYVEGNVIATGDVAGPPGALHPIFVAGLGPYVIAHNSVDVQWPIGTGAAISVRDGGWRVTGAIVVDNDVNMGAPEGTIFDSNSAGIEIRGDVQGSVVLNNRIRGRARAALAVAGFRSGAPPLPANNAFVLNRFDHFEASLAGVFVGDGVMNTLIVGQGTVEDHGVGTVIVPVAGGGGEDKDKDEDKDDR